MLEVFYSTLTQMLVMFFFIIIGYVLNKCKILPEDTSVVLSKLENYVLVPALVMNNFMQYCTVESISKKYPLVLYSIGVLAIALVIALVLSGVFTKDAYQKNIYKYALTFGNFSFMGTAVIKAMYGDDMLFNYLMFVLPLNLMVYTWGMIILIPKKTGINPLKNLLNPVFIGMILGAVIGLLDLSKYLPKFFTDTVSSAGACMAPIAMILTGFVVANYDLKKLLLQGRVYIATALRLIVLPTLFVLGLKALGADQTTLIVALMAYATPLGLNTVVFPAAYGGDTTTGASMALISHTIAVITIPLMFAVFIGA